MFEQIYIYIFEITFFNNAFDADVGVGVDADVDVVVGHKLYNYLCVVDIDTRHHAHDLQYFHTYGGSFAFEKYILDLHNKLFHQSTKAHKNYHSLFVDIHLDYFLDILNRYRI